MTAQAWSLRNRLTWWVSLVTTVPLAATFLVGGLFLGRSVSREIDALVHEELEEALGHLGLAADSMTHFEPISRQLAAQHPGTPMAWRFRDAATGRVLADYGETRLFGEGAPPLVPGEQPIDLGDGMRTMTVATSPEVTLGIVLDGASHLVFLHRYWILAGGIFALGAVAALVSSRILARRVAALVRGVADSVSADRQGDPDAAAERTAPEEVREVAAALRRDFRRVRDEAERIRVFTAGLAHELRSPIQNLMGETEVALMRERDPESYRRLLASQLEELSDLADAVDNLLTMCTIAPARNAAEEQFDLAQEAGLRLAREQARGERGQVDVLIHAVGDTNMSGDREHVLRGLRNIVANAVDWSPAGGRVGVSLDGEGQDIVVTVDDDGPGVPESDRARIFEPFVRGPQRARERIGYGLGLAIAKASVERHGGRIAVCSSPSGGARFRMTFQRRVET